jgi:hypothetical protein
VKAAWSGRIGSDVVDVQAPTPARVTVDGQRDLFVVTIDTAGRTAPHVIRTRRPAPASRIRLCRTRGCVPGLEIHAPTADLLLVFDDRDTRDRLAATLR